MADAIPMVFCSVAGVRIVGRLTIGNRHGLLLPEATTDQELQHLRNSLPESVQIRRVNERLSALGNVVICNDHVAIVHADIGKDLETALKEVLKVEVYRMSLGNHALVSFPHAFSLIVDSSLNMFQKQPRLKRRLIFECFDGILRFTILKYLPNEFQRSDSLPL